jgi:hypothetical protein
MAFTVILTNVHEAMCLLVPTETHLLLSNLSDLELYVDPN